MSACLTLDTVSLATPDGTPLFGGLTLSLGAEAVGLVGRNGCGKSTLLAAIAGDLLPASGSIHAHATMAYSSSALMSARRSPTRWASLRRLPVWRA